MKNRENTIKAIEESKIIGIIRGLEGETLLKTVSAMVEGGIKVVEFPLDHSGKVPYSVTMENVKMVSKEFAGKLSVGVGTVLTEEQVDLAKENGAELIFSPDTFEPVIKRTRELGLVSVPGAFTPTECANAHRFGADFVKLFPNSEVKPSYLKAISLPLPHIKFLLFGGVNIDNMAEYLSIGAKGFGIATAIVNKKLIGEGDFTAITEITEKFINAVK